MWIYSVRNVLNYSSVVPYASQGRSPAGAGLGLLRCRFWGHRRYSGVLGVEPPSLSLVLGICLALLPVPLCCLIAPYLLLEPRQLPLLVFDLPLLLLDGRVFSGMCRFVFGCLLVVLCFCGLRPLCLLLMVHDFGVEYHLLFFIALFDCGFDCSLQLSLEAAVALCLPHSKALR